MKLLLVEDDVKLGSFLTRALGEEGYETELCTTGADAIGACRRTHYDLIVLDWMLPDGDGVFVCKELRRAGFTTPILMLTARGEVRDRVQGLEAGADDYLIKPFEVEELVARVRALLRRSVGLTTISVDRLEIDRLARRATLDGIHLDLTTREFALLLFFASSVGETFSRAQLLEKVWDMSFDPSSNLVEVHISRLRDKLGGYSWLIETVRGAGYRMRASRAAPAGPPGPAR